jgi:hypothetical protein
MMSHVRFETSRTLDAIETRLSLDPLVAQGVVDLAETVFRADFDGGRPAQLLRLGLIIDAVSAYLGDERAAVYAIAPRALLSDNALTSNERMVIRRWADDGLVEVVNELGDRIREVATVIGLPIVSQRPVRSGWWIAPQPAPGGVTAKPGGEAPADGTPADRWWRCPEPDCASFGAHTIGRSQPPPARRRGAATCPRHDVPLADAGGRPRQVAMVIRIAGEIRQRFTLTAGLPVLVGRAPDEGIALAGWLDENGTKWVSRTHVKVELTSDGVAVTDLSTNGTNLLARGGPMQPVQPRRIGKGATQLLHALDFVSLYEGVELGRAGRMVADGTRPLGHSVMADAPTMSLKVRDL